MSRRRRLTLFGSQRALAGIDNIAAAYSLRMLVKGYSGPLINIRRNQDDAEIDIYARPDGSVDTAAITSFLNSSSPASTTAFVTTWYDQSGNDRHATQSTASAQPTFQANIQNGRAGILFATNDYYSANSLATIGSASHSVIFSALPDANPSVGDFYAFGVSGDAGDQEKIEITGTGTLRHTDTDSVTLDSNDWEDVPFVLSMTFNNTTATAKLNNANPNTTSSFADGLRSGLNEFSIGQEFDAAVPSNFYNGHLFDMIITSDVISSTNRTAVDTNLMAYLGIS